MSFLLRVVLPDAPGMLGKLATALGEVGADIVSVDIVERGHGEAVDDLVVDLPAGRLPDSLISASSTVPGVFVESIRPYAGGPLDTRRELEVIEWMADRPAEATTSLADALPRIFRAGWAVVVRVLPEGDQAKGVTVEAASNAAPDLDEVDLPWLPLAKAAVLEPEAAWVPDSWQHLGTELVAAPLGGPERAVLLGRPGGPAFRTGEVLRLSYLTGIAATVLGTAR